MRTRGLACFGGSFLWACFGCGGLTPNDRPTPNGQMADAYLRVAPNRQIDMVFSIDNSPGTAPKVTKMNAQLTKLISALRDAGTGELPDLRIGVIDSDLGTGCRYASGSCGPRHADGSGCFGDQGLFQTLNQPVDCRVDPDARFLEVKSGTTVGFTGDINNVFACLASNLGTLGCGEEAPLQAFEFALAAKGVGNEAQQASFLRPLALLALVFITDEDDCSAYPNDGMFGDRPELRGESASLRCATRGHACGGRPLVDAPPGYPTSASFSHSFSDCRARNDTCPDGTDTSGATGCSPLRNVKEMADSLKALKAEPDRQILAAGIFGWPLGDADMPTAEYKIAPVPNPNIADTQHPTVFDYFPVCYDPGHPPRHPDANGFDAEAAGWGATGGLRNAAFLDEFGANGLKFSICQPDLADTMTTIGNRLASMMAIDGCLDLDLADADPSTDGIQPECNVYWQTAEPDPGNPMQVLWREDPTALAQCPTGATSDGVTADCWYLVSDFSKCPTSGRWLEVLRTPAETAANPTLPPGTRLHVRCRTVAA